MTSVSCNPRLNENDNDNIEEGLAAPSSSASDPPGTATTMAGSLDARTAATMTIERIEDEAAPAPFNPMEFEDDHRAVSTKTTAAAAAAAIAADGSNDNNDGDVCKHNRSRPRRRYHAHVDEEEEDDLVNRHEQRTDVTSVLLVENNTLREFDSINQNAIPEAFLVEERDEEVISACPIPPNRPWWKQRRTQLLLGTVCILSAALAISVGVTLGISLGMTLGTSSPDEPTMLSQIETPPVSKVTSAPTLSPHTDNPTVAPSLSPWRNTSTFAPTFPPLATTPPVAPTLPPQATTPPPVAPTLPPQATTPPPVAPMLPPQATTPPVAPTLPPQATTPPVAPTLPPQATTPPAAPTLPHQVTPAPTVVLRGDWEFCYKNNECKNGCCSREYSDDGKLKCTPLTGDGFLPDVCTAV